MSAAPTGSAPSGSAPTGSAPVVTGLGVIAPSGLGVDEFWPAVRDGHVALAPIGRFEPNPYPVTVAGEVTGFGPDGWVEPRITVQTDRFTHFALAAADLALRDAALDPAAVAPFEFGVMTASYSGGVEFGQREIERLWRHGPEHVGPYQSIAWFYAACSGQISIGNGLRGPSGVLVADEAGGLDVLAAAGVSCDEARGPCSAARKPRSARTMCCQLGWAAQHLRRPGHGLSAVHRGPGFARRGRRHARRGGRRRARRVLP
ncbi:beta-ketoacyl synthase N-terminal-like domain-containing protein [Lentzea guizhouensis]|uniref:beta-ketoacyl synthase N-terminal-like domain-containing protein n=1 Tax=Lentzea guizhouensis TaxID=1586287 RepID=UPI001F44CFAC|nr:beta-ketoacyl synthase N-terminal-like domain-containing protein [Lentzea guizhouensis]